MALVGYLSTYSLVALLHVRPFRLGAGFRLIGIRHLLARHELSHLA